MAFSLLVWPALTLADPRTFGTPSSVHTIQAFAFTGDADDSGHYVSNIFRSRYCTILPCTFRAAVSLPAGARVTAFELEACDENASATVSASLDQHRSLEAPNATLVIVSTVVPSTVPGAPGCVFVSEELAFPHTIDNLNNTYTAEVRITGAGESLAVRFRAVRIFYNLQVSPPPASATFADVPAGHAFFAFVEALAAAGVTTGCNSSPPLYCPDSFITRGQMAAFLSRALGLQFAP